MKERNSSSKKGIRPAWVGGKHPRGMLGKKAWNSGCSLDAAHREKIRAGRQNNPKCTGVASTKEKELLRRQRISKTASLNKKSGGYRIGCGCGRSHGSWYESPNAGRVYLDSTWEVLYAKFLDRSDVKWERNTKRFSYTWQNSNHGYIPDFFLTETNSYVEVKGYTTKKDLAKWDSFRNIHKLTLIVMTKLELTELGLL
jgi:hypothetical protein